MKIEFDQGPQRDAIKQIVVVGGGTAGWLTASVLAADHMATSPNGLQITLIESPDVPTIGVGEGTWPTMRETLRRIGLSETRFLLECDATFKQGSRFDGWLTGAPGERYYHPFVAPAGYGELDSPSVWGARGDGVSFADAVCHQPHLCVHGRAPKQTATPEYAAVATYAYHLDAGKFADLLRRHATEKLGVRHVSDHVTGVTRHASDDIAAVVGERSGAIEGDLFIDCTGLRALLLDGCFGARFIDRGDVLFNDTALAARVPARDPAGPIESQTIGTAEAAGWIWDIGLPTRRGVGYVYSSAHATADEARQTLARYIESVGGDARAAGDDMRTISFRSGHRDAFWRGNCVAVGMAAGFLEPLEASALVMVELSAAMISEEMPAQRAAMPLAAERFNDTFRYRWDRIIDFLKLHYVLSRRDEAYWRDHRDAASIPERLADLLLRWRHQSPSRRDFPQIDEVFPAASYQYVLYGMGCEPPARATASRATAPELAERVFARTAADVRKFLSGLPSNRELLDHYKRRALADA